MLKPTQDFILIKRKEKEKKTNSGIILTNTQTDKYDVLEGTVIKTGPGRKTPDGKNIIPVEAKEGDKILYKQYAGHHLVIDDVDYWLINDRDVIAIIE